MLTVTNRARPALRILKYDLTSNSPMPDVTYKMDARFQRIEKDQLPRLRLAGL